MFAHEDGKGRIHISPHFSSLAMHMERRGSLMWGAQLGAWLPGWTSTCVTFRQIQCRCPWSHIKHRVNPLWAIPFKIVFCATHPTGLLKLSTIVLLFPGLAAVLILSRKTEKEVTLVWHCVESRAGKKPAILSSQNVDHLYHSRFYQHFPLRLPCRGF